VCKALQGTGQRGVKRKRKSLSFRFAIVHRQTWNENRIEIHDNMKIVTS
jgi:hypothetical protein